MRVKFWGVRGSTPTPQPENMRYGGNTSCVEVRVGEQVYIFDCGTGFRNLGQHLLQEFVDRPLAAHIFVSHFHWDTFRAAKESTGDEESPNGVGNYGGYVEEGDYHVEETHT